VEERGRDAAAGGGGSAGDGRNVAGVSDVSAAGGRDVAEVSEVAAGGGGVAAGVSGNFAAVFSGGLRLYFHSKHCRSATRRNSRKLAVTRVAPSRRA
jgi:hypothetical protein